MTTPPGDTPGNPWAEEPSTTWGPRDGRQVPPRPALTPPGHQPYSQPGAVQPAYGQPGHPPVYVMPLKSAGIAYLLWILLGGFGAHRFYLGRPGGAIGQLILCLLGWATLWVFFLGLVFLIPLWVWLFIDLFLIPGHTRDAHSRMTGYRHH